MNVPEHVLISCFVSCLRHDIRKETQYYRPQSLVQVMGLAKLYADKFSDNSVYSPAWGENAQTVVQRASPSSTTLPPLLPNPPGQKRPCQIKKLTTAEMLACREKGLCYNCDEKFIFGHKCQGQFFLLVTDEDDPIEDCIIEPTPMLPKLTENLFDKPEISLHARAGQPSPRTLR